MPTETTVPDDESGPDAPTPGASAATSTPEAPTWWESIRPAYMPAGAWSPDSPSSLRLTAPASSGWMPPASSFRSLAHGSSLPTAGAEPGEAMKAAAEAAATVAGDAIEAAQSTADVTLASAESTARSVAHDTAASAEGARDDAIASARSALSVDPVTVSSFREAVAGADRETAEELVAAERRRVHDVMTQAQGSIGSRLQAARDAVSPAGVTGLRASVPATPSGPAVRPATEGVFAAQSSVGAVRPYDPSAIASAVTGATGDPTATFRGAVPGDRLRAARGVIDGATDPARQASIRRQSGILTGVAIALGVIMTFCVLGGDFDAGPEESAGFAVGILLTAIAQVVVLVWAVVLVIRWRLAGIPKTGARPGRAIWITLILSPVPLFIFQNSLSSM